jgi:dTDP-4-amino-4,6-dideoxygalactose transaminase
MGLKSDDEVIVPSLTWTATASVVIQAGAKVVFADVDRKTWCLDPKDVKAKITKKTKLVVPVHFAGRFAVGFEDFPVPVLYDSAHRMEKADFKNTASCYSFYAVKNMTTVRGGMILTNNKKDAEWYLMSVHGGLVKDTLSRYIGTKSQGASDFYYEVAEPGWNFDMTDVEAAIGREQLKKLPGLNKRRDEIVKIYNREFGLNNTGNHLYPILVKNRDQFLVDMRSAGIHCGIHYLPLHLMSGYKHVETGKLANTEFIGKHCVSLPLYPTLTESEINYIILSVKKHSQIIK